MKTIDPASAIAPLAERRRHWAEAIRRQRMGVIRDLASQGKFDAVRSSVGNALKLAVQLNDAETMTALLRAGADPNWVDQKGRSAAYWASTQGQTENLRILLEAGANPNGPEGSELIWHAISQGNLRVVEVLLRGGASVDVRDARGATLLHRALEFGFPDIARRLMRAGLSVHSVDREDETAMHYAARNAVGFNCLALLKEHRLNIDALTIFDMTPLLVAAQRGSKRTFEAFVAMGADTTARDMHGRSALDLALADTGPALHKDEIALWLMQNEPSLIPAGEALDRAFVQAVTKGQTQLVQKLAELGADVGQKPFGRTLLQCAPKDAEDLKRVLRSFKSGALIESAMSGRDAAPPTHSSPIL